MEPVLPDEVWRPVVGAAGHYEVSSLGRVRSVDRVVRHSRNPNMHVTRRGMLLKPGKHRSGHLFVWIHGRGRPYMMFVHRLVAQAFLPGSDLLEVNHIVLVLKIKNNWPN